jgi:uncharacterized membrane protein
VPEERPEYSDKGTERSVDRLINFSDAVVAVAITLMALPLVDIAGPVDGGSIWPVMWDHAAQITTFLFTFGVVAIMWSAHNRIMNEMRAYDGFIFWVNTAWLASIVLLPWMSALYGESASRTSVGILYWGVLALISLLGSLLGRHLRKNPSLRGGEESGTVLLSSRAAWRGPAFAGYFLAIGVTSLFAPFVASWMPLGIIPLSMYFRPARPDRAPSDSSSPQPAEGET